MNVVICKWHVCGCVCVCAWVCLLMCIHWRVNEWKKRAITKHLCQHTYVKICMSTHLCQHTYVPYVSFKCRVSSKVVVATCIDSYDMKSSKWRLLSFLGNLTQWVHEITSQTHNHCVALQSHHVFPGVERVKPTVGNYRPLGWWFYTDIKPDD